VDFDDLMTRLNRYKTEERAAEERFSATCRMTSDGALEALAVLAAAASKGEPPDADPFEQTLGG
jgi:hypothetical protein